MFSFCPQLRSGQVQIRAEVGLLDSQSGEGGVWCLMCLIDERFIKMP